MSLPFNHGHSRLLRLTPALTFEPSGVYHAQVKGDGLLYVQAYHHGKWMEYVAPVSRVTPEAWKILNIDVPEIEFEIAEVP